jgi:HlyD family secretion protein
MLNYFKSHKLITAIGAGVIVVLLLAFGLLRGNAAAANQTYQTEKIGRGDLTATIGATGTVRASQSATLTWQTGGVVESVTAGIGDVVQADQVLAQLDQTSLPQNVILAEADLVSAQQALDDLLASETSQAQAEQSVVTAQKAVQDAQDNVDSLLYPRASDELIKNTQAQIDLARRKVARMADAYRQVNRLPDGNTRKAEAELNLTNAQMDLDNLIAKYNWYTGKADTLDAADYRAQLVTAQAQLADAQRELERLKDGPSADDVAAARARVAAAQATLNQARIISPFPGTVTDAGPLVGDKVTAGQTAFRVDNLTSLLIDLDVSEVDINSVMLGQEGTITFDAVPSRGYHGRVVAVSQAATVTNGAVNFKVTVQLTDADAQVKPGMTAAVEIDIHNVTGALLVPNKAVRVVDGKRVVYIMQDGGMLPVSIELGASSENYSEVTGGDLKEGDQVVLNPPANAQEFRPGSGNGMMRTIRQ